MTTRAQELTSVISETVPGCTDASRLARAIVGARAEAVDIEEPDAVPPRVAPEQPDARYTPTVDRILAAAVAEARALHHHYVGTEHLSLAMCREPASIGGYVLTGFPGGVEGVRRAVLELVGADEPVERDTADNPVDDIGRRYADRVLSVDGNRVTLGPTSPEGSSLSILTFRDLAVCPEDRRSRAGQVIAGVVNAAVAEATAERDATLATLRTELAGVERRASGGGPWSPTDLASGRGAAGEVSRG